MGCILHKIKAIMRAYAYLFLAFLAGILLVTASCTDHPGKEAGKPAVADPAAQPPVRPAAPESPLPTPAGFDRKAKRLIFTKHARCRMDCRHIDEQEVREILEKGRVNLRKSEPTGRPDPKYALEGSTRDGQQVRIVFAPASRGMVVITVIDLDREWACHCK